MTRAKAQRRRETNERSDGCFGVAPVFRRAPVACAARRVEPARRTMHVVPRTPTNVTDDSNDFIFLRLCAFAPLREFLSTEPPGPGVPI